MRSSAGGGWDLGLAEYGLVLAAVAALVGVVVAVMGHTLFTVWSNIASLLGPVGSG